MQKKKIQAIWLKIHCIFSSFLLFCTNYVNLHSYHPPKETRSSLQMLREDRKKKKKLGPVSNVDI